MIKTAIQLKAKIRNISGSDGPREYLPTEWISTNKKVATIDENGRITFHKKGKTKIIAVFGRGKLSTKKKIKTTLKRRI